jgi:hypothetical protein
MEEEEAPQRRGDRLTMGGFMRVLRLDRRQHFTFARTATALGVSGYRCHGAGVREHAATSAHCSAWPNSYAPAA